MAKNPSTVFYWVDWTSDPAVRSCSMAARGMWMEMLALAAAAGGYVKVGGQSCSISRLAEITGQDRRSVGRWIDELERKGVFSRTEDGTIFCRRMVRDAAARAAKQADPGARSRQKSARSVRKADGINQSDLLDNPTPKTEKSAPSYSDSGSVASSKDSEPSLDKPESLDAAPAREGEGKNTGKGNPEEGRYAPLGAKTRMPARWSDRHRDGECDEQASQAPASDYRGLDRQDQGHGVIAERAASSGAALPGRARPPPPYRVAKSPALRAKIREQLANKHGRYLMARRRPREVAAYWAAQLDPDPAVGRRVFDEVDRRMRAERWNDMLGWRPRRGFQPIGDAEVVNEQAHGPI
jgi:hypothetical protein